MRSRVESALETGVRKRKEIEGARDGECGGT